MERDRGSATDALKTMLERAKDDLRETEAEFEEVKARRERLRGKVEAFRLALLNIGDIEQRSSRSVPRHVRDTKPARIISWEHMTRPQAVEMALRTNAEAMTPSDLSRFLKDQGRVSDEPNFISATLDRLKHRGRVVSLGGGRWSLSDHEPPGDKRTGDLLGLARRKGVIDE
ncbi:MAG: hypothetical protein M3345_04290 [Actinomycetota bacterium]|nr:hypothetical protein [Actinomycetota bacterium]